MSIPPRHYWNPAQCHDCVKCYLAVHVPSGMDLPIQHCRMTGKSAVWERSIVPQGAVLAGKNCGPEGQFFERIDYAR